MADHLERGNAFLIFRIGALFTGIFGVLGLILASIGLYGVVAYDVTQRTHEIGVRMALGALRVDILREVLRRGARLAASGALLGVAIGAGRRSTASDHAPRREPVRSAHVRRHGAAAFGVCLLASFVPARRAATASPLDALRAD